MRTYMKNGLKITRFEATEIPPDTPKFNDDLPEQTLIIGLLTSEKLCDELLSYLNPSMFEIDLNKFMFKWICQFWKAQHKVLGKNFYWAYKQYGRAVPYDETFHKRFVKYSQVMSFRIREAMEDDAGFYVSASYECAKKMHLNQMLRKAQEALEEGDYGAASSLVENFKPIEEIPEFDDCFSFDEEFPKFCQSIIDKAEARKNEMEDEREADRSSDRLFRCKGAAGNVFGNFKRGDFVSVTAPMKRGKSFALTQLGAMALKEGLNVLHVSLEMSKAQNMKRYCQYLYGETFSDEERTVRSSRFVDDGNGKFKLETREVTKAPMSAKLIKKMKFRRRHVEAATGRKWGRLEMIVSSVNGLTVQQLDKRLELYAKRGFVPDVICLDYADLMGSTRRSDELRHKLDDIWGRTRALASERNCVVFTATQAGRDTFKGKGNVDVTNVSEDIRKVAHVTCMVSINQTEDEKKLGVVRLRQLVVRDETPIMEEVVCTQNLDVGMLFGQSRYKSQTTFSAEDELKKLEDAKREKGDAEEKETLGKPSGDSDFTVTWGGREKRNGKKKRNYAALFEDSEIKNE